MDYEVVFSIYILPLIDRGNVFVDQNNQTEDKQRSHLSLRWFNRIGAIYGVI